MQDVRKYKDPNTGQTMTVKALTVSSNGRTKTVRILKNATELLKWIGYYEIYADRFLNTSFHGDAEHLDRNHRVAETAALFLRAGCPVITDKDADMGRSGMPALYLANVFKSVNDEPDPKSLYTRVSAGYRAKGNCFAVYNTRDRAMKWLSGGEIKTALLLREKFRCDLTGAILLGKDYETGMRAAIKTSAKGSKTPFYQNWRKLYFLPLDENGIRLIEMVSQRNVSERILEMMFDPDVRSYGNGTFNYHAKVDGAYIYSFLDSDLRGLIEFRNGLHTGDASEILCYDFQTDFIKDFFREYESKITIIPYDAVRNNLL